MTHIHILGAGIIGVMQALTHAKQGYDVTLWDPGGIPSRASASSLAGAMLGPYCEREAGHELIRELGVESLRLWREIYPKTIDNGTLVVASSRDQSELKRFALMTDGYEWLNAKAVCEIEPDLGARYSQALFFPKEAHLDPRETLADLTQQACELGVTFKSEVANLRTADWIVDCRGMGAKPEFKTLRGVRGERIVLECGDIHFKRPVRFLHPRQSIYVVPWGEKRFMLGATVIESDDRGAATLRSAVELMSAAYALHPAFAEARIVDIAANVRPAFPDNLPKIIVRDRHIFVNGLYRHGFLLAPILAKLTTTYIQHGKRRDGVVFEDHGEW